MGCGGSTGKPPFANTPQRSVADAACEANVGKVVHVVGFVQPAQKLIRTPFAEEACVACSVNVLDGGADGKGAGLSGRTGGGVEGAALGNAIQGAALGALNKAPKVFKSHASVPFVLEENGATVVIDAAVLSTDGSPLAQHCHWKLRAEPKHAVFDLMWAAPDDEEAIIGHVGGSPGHRDDSEPMRDALGFWQRLSFLQKNALRQLNHADGAGGGGHMMMAKESVIVAGERVAVVGKLVKRDDGAFAIQADATQPGAITNMAWFAPSLNAKLGQYVPTAGHLASDLTAVPMIDSLA